MSLSSSLLPTCAVRHPVCVRPSCTSWPHRWHRSESGPWARLRTAMRRSTPPTPGALARVRVLVSRSVVTYSTPSAPRSQAHRDFTAQQLIRDAFAVRERLSDPRAVPGFRCAFCAGMPPSSTTGSSTSLSSRTTTSTRPSSRVEQLGTPKTPAIRFTRGDEFRGSLVHTSATACQLARPPERI